MCNKSPARLELFVLDRVLWQQQWSFMCYIFIYKYWWTKVEMLSSINTWQHFKLNY